MAGLRIRRNRPYALFAVVLGACGDVPQIVVEPLQVVSWEPNQGAQCVAPKLGEFTANVVFSADVDTQSLTTDTLYVQGPAGIVEAETVNYDKATYSAEPVLKQDLAFSTQYELVATRDIKGAGRGHLVSELRSVFTTLSAAGCMGP